MVLIIILSINFLLPRMMPGDPVYTLLGHDGYEKGSHANQAFIDSLRAKYGLDKPLYEQYIIYFLSLAHNDLGYSIQKGSSVADLITDKLLWTILLLMPSIAVGELLALLLGTIAGFNQGRKIDGIITSVCVFVHTVPAFLMAMIFMRVFSYHLSWFPLGHFTGGTSEGIDYFFDAAWHMALPMIILVLIEVTYTFFVVRNSIMQINDEYFIFVARSKGLSDTLIAFRHVMKNVLPQFISMAALGFSYMVSGALIIEIVFSLDGMGTLIYDAVMARDYPVMQGSFLVITIAVISMNFLAEMLYGLVDPRVSDPGFVQSRW